MGSVLKISDTWYNLLHSECKRRKKSSSEAFLWAPGMSSGRDGPSVSREGRDSPATQRNKYNKIENDTSAAFVLVVGILKVFGKHTSGSYSSLIAFLKENKLKYKALSSLLSCLVQFPLPSVGVTPEQLEAGSRSPCNLTSPITSVRCHDMNLGVAVWICSGVTVCNTYLGADKNMFSFCPSIFLTCVIFLVECWRECTVKNWMARQRSVWGRTLGCCKRSYTALEVFLQENQSWPMLLHHRIKRGHKKRWGLHFCSHRAWNLIIALMRVLVCAELCPFCVHMCPCSSGSGDQGEISQPTFAAKLHFTYTKSKENSIFNLIFID